MTQDLCWDLTDEDDDGYFNPDTARELLDQLPVWSQTAELDEAPRMAAELRAFFRFAERTKCVKTASRWAELLGADDIEKLLRYTMLHDRRLRRRPPRKSDKSRRRKRTRRTRRKRRRS